MLKGELVYTEAQSRKISVRLSFAAKKCHYRVRDLAQYLGISTNKFQREFRLVTGVGPKWWLCHQRMKEARYLLLSGQTSKEIARELSFGHQTKFSEAFRKVYGLNPIQMIEEEQKRRLQGMIGYSK